MNPVKKLISLSGYNQKEFANKVGETEPALSLYKSGKRQITLKKFLDWCAKINFRAWDQIF